MIFIANTQMYELFRFIIIAFVLRVTSALLDEKISNHFQSDNCFLIDETASRSITSQQTSSKIYVFTDFQKHWQLYRKSYENAIILALKDSYGHKGMNIYVRRSDDSLRISDGFYLTDNVVDLMLLDMTLTSLPYLTNPKVTFALASNVLTVEAGLSKMIVETNYLLFRNQSDILNTSLQDAYENSPFSFQQVENVGHLVIVAEDCMLVGYTLAKLSGHSVNLGHDTFQVRNCKFSIEISPYRPGFPPVIAPYFSKEQGALLELLLTKPIHEEFMPKFQAAVFSYVNTSLIFGEHLSKFRQYQDNIFREVSKNVTGLVRFLNNLTTASQQETINVDPLEVSWNVLCQQGSCWNSFLIHNVTLHGLDTLYSSHNGGPFKLQSPLVAEALRFDSIVVRGSILFKNDTLKEEYSFVAELKDITQNVEIDYNKLKLLFKFSNWRKMGLSVIEVEKNLRNRKVNTAFVSGYLMNKLPRVLEKYFTIHLQSGESQGHKLRGCVGVCWWGK